MDIQGYSKYTFFNCSTNIAWRRPCAWLHMIAHDCARFYCIFSSLYISVNKAACRMRWIILIPLPHFCYLFVHFEQLSPVYSYLLVNVPFYPGTPHVTVRPSIGNYFNILSMNYSYRYNVHMYVRPDWYQYVRCRPKSMNVLVSHFMYVARLSIYCRSHTYGCVIWCVIQTQAADRLLIFLLAMSQLWNLSLLIIFLIIGSGSEGLESG